MKRILILLNLFFLSGCFLPNDGMGYRNEYFINIYYDFIYTYPSLHVELINNKATYYIKYNNTYNLEIYDFKDYIFKIDFFQDAENKCYLFSKSNKELFDLEKIFSKSNKGVEPIFLIEKDDIRVVSMDEYERIKPTLKPHPYDPSLCKPKPVDLK